MYLTLSLPFFGVFCNANVKRLICLLCNGNHNCFPKNIQYSTIAGPPLPPQHFSMASPWGLSQPRTPACSSQSIRCPSWRTRPANNMGGKIDMLSTRKKRDASCNHGLQSNLSHQGQNFYIPAQISIKLIPLSKILSVGGKAGLQISHRNVPYQH